MSPSNNRSINILRSSILALLSGISLSGLAQQEASLELALVERDQGRLFNAQRILNGLRDEAPGSSRLKLEAAVLYVQLKDFDAADRLLTELLASDTDLPDRVRVNVQLLQLKNRQLQQQERHTRLNVYASTGVAYDNGLEQPGLVFDSLIGATHSAQLPVSNVQGYALFTEWHNQGQLSYLDDAESEDLTAYVSTGLNMELHHVRVSPGLNYRRLRDGGEPGWYLNASWQPTAALHWSSALSRRWLLNNENEHSGKASVSLLNDKATRVSFSYYYRFNEQEGVSATRHRLGSELKHDSTGRWALGLIQTIDARSSDVDTLTYLNYDHPLNHGFGVTGALRYETYGNNTATGYGRLGVRWRK